MLEKIYQVYLKRPPPGLELGHPLHIGFEEDFIKVHGVIKDLKIAKKKLWFIGALMRNYPVIYESFDCLYTQVHIIKTSASIDDSEILYLYVTEYFLKHYGFNYDDVYYFKSVLCKPIEKIVLGAKTAKSFMWFQDPNIYEKYLVQCCKQNILCRQDDILLALPTEFPGTNASDFFDYITLDCQPFRQGLLTSRSSFVVADVRDIPDFSSKTVTCSNSGSEQISLINLINYTSSNILGLRLPNPSATPLSASISALKIFHSFEICVMPMLNTDFLMQLESFTDEIDLFSAVFMSCNSLKKLHLINGSWVKIRLCEPSKVKPASLVQSSNISKEHLKSAKSSNRLARVFCIDNENLLAHFFQNNERVYISPLLWFNLNSHPSLLMQPDCRLQIEPLELNFSPPYASEAHACLIQSPSYDGHVNCDNMLSKYFSIPRYVCIGDIFSLNSKDQLDFHSKIRDEEVDKLRWPVVHFRISLIDGPKSSLGYLLSNTHARLYQTGTKQNYVPITMETYYQLSPYHPVWNAVPEGLAYYIYHIQDLILPFLKLESGQCQISSNILFSGPPCCGKTTVVKAVCKCLNLHLYQVNCHELGGETSAVAEARLKNKIEKGCTYAPCIILLKNIHCIGREREASAEDSRVLHSLANLLKTINSHGSEWRIIVIGTTTDSKLVSSNLVSAFLHSVVMKAADEEERGLLLQDLLSVCDVSNDVSVHYLAQRTAGFVLGDLCALVNQGIRNAYSRTRKLIDEYKMPIKEEEDIILSCVPIVQRDLLNALEKLQSEFAEAIGAPKIPNVMFEDIGGLSHVKQEILDTIQLPLEHPEILSSGLRRSGVLLYGPPGSGKTLLAKAVATECSLNFLSVKGPELINMYVGQSEENVRAVFNQARSAVPCIIFFDELDSLAPNRGRSGDSGGVMDRVVSQLLAELDGLNKKSEVFVIGATNRPDLIDPALLRPGRFDRLLYVGIPEDKSSKLSILRALTRKFPLAEDVDLEKIIEKCPPYLSGADFYSLCSNAVIKRVEKNVELLEKGNVKIEELSCEVQNEDFLRALESLVPSVSPTQYQQYQEIRSRINN